MAKKNLFLTVLLWLEIVVCLRVLLFVLPVWMNQYTSGVLGVMKLDDWFMVVITVAVFLHGLAAIFCLKNFSAGKSIHFFSLGVFLFLTCGLAVLYRYSTRTIAPQYFYPLIGSFVFSITINLATSKTRAL